MSIDWDYCIKWGVFYDNHIFKYLSYKRWSCERCGEIRYDRPFTKSEIDAMLKSVASK